MARRASTERKQGRRSMMVIRARAATDFRCGLIQWRGRAVLVQREPTGEHLAMERDR
jgi:hypothetical protein